MTVAGHTSKHCFSCQRDTDHVLVEIQGVLLKFCVLCMPKKLAQNGNQRERQGSQ